MIELTQEQQRAVDAGPLPQLIDPRTCKPYYLIGADVYDRIRNLVGGEEDGLHMRQVATLINGSMREEDADDPLLESYQNYRRTP